MKKLLSGIKSLFSSGAGSGSMDRQDFSEYFMRRAAETLREAEFEMIKPLHIKSRINGREVTTFLMNAYTRYNAHPDTLDAVIGSQVAALAAQGGVEDKTGHAAVFAVLKPVDYLDTVRQQLAQAGVTSEEIPLVYEQLNEELYVFYVFDSEHGMRMVAPSDMVDLNLDRAALRALAVQNLGKHVERTGLSVRTFDEVAPARIYMLSVDQNYEASLLLLDGLWTPENFAVSGDIVVFVPGREVVFVTGLDDSRGMLLASRMAQQAYGELGYAISPRGFQRVAGSWKPLGAASETDLH